MTDHSGLNGFAEYIMLNCLLLGKSVSSSTKNHGVVETGEELEVPDGQIAEDTLLPAEDNPQSCIQLNEGTEGEDGLISSR